jgi:hypothetical protein
MQAEKITHIKKELSTLSSKELSEICLRLAKYKKENKELLTYLLYDAGNPMEYAEKVKQSLKEDFINLQKHHYSATKSLRKTLRTLNRHAKYTGSKQVEIELLIWFCQNFLNYAETRSSYKPLRALFDRQLEKIALLTNKLHEDLQFDYQQELKRLLDLASEKMGAIIKKI